MLVHQPVIMVVRGFGLPMAAATMLTARRRIARPFVAMDQTVIVEVAGWSVVGHVGETPSGLLAEEITRRAADVSSAVPPGGPNAVKNYTALLVKQESL